MGFLRSLVSLVILLAVVIAAATVPLGSRTFFGHVSRIWEAEETRELVDGVKETAAPVVDKVKRGAKAGWEAVASDDGGTSPAPAAEEPALRDQVADEVAEAAGEAVKQATKDRVAEELSGE